MRHVSSVVVAMKPVTLALIAALVLPVPTSHATIFDFFATLSGPAEAPPNMSPGTGTATVTINDVTDSMHVTANFSGLLAPTIMAHIHLLHGGSAHGNRGGGYASTIIFCFSVWCDIRNV